MPKPISIVAVLLLLTGASGQDAPKIDGTWRVDYAERDAKDVTAGFKRISFKFSGDRVSLLFEGSCPHEGVFKLDTEKKPAHIEWTVGEETHKGIYELKGDVLRMCIAGPGTERPAQFETKRGSETFLVVLRREKAK